MGRMIATAVAISTALLVLAGFFVPVDTAGVAGQMLGGFSFFFTQWAPIVAVFALFLGVFNVFRVHFSRIREREGGWPYSFILLLAMIFSTFVGLMYGPYGAPSRWMFESILLPLEATIFSLLAFFVLSAAYRAFRVRSMETALFVIVGIVVLLGQVPLGSIISYGQLPIIKEWFVNVPAMGGARGIMLGVALGTMAAGIRVILGIDRPYTG